MNLAGSLERTRDDTSSDVEAAKNNGPLTSKKRATDQNGEEHTRCSR